MKERRVATVMRNSNVTLNKHHYSVPTDYVGKRVELVYDADTVSIYHGFRLITAHRRSDVPYEYRTKSAHNLPVCRGSLEWDLDEIYQRAAQMDNIVRNYLKEVTGVIRCTPQGPPFMPRNTASGKEIYAETSGGGMCLRHRDESLWSGRP